MSSKADFILLIDSLGTALSCQIPLSTTFLEEICGLLIINERIRNLSHTQSTWQIKRKGAYQCRYEQRLRAWPDYLW